MKIPEYNVGDVVRIKRDLWKCISLCGVVPGMPELAGEVTVITDKIWAGNFEPPQFIYHVKADKEIFVWDYQLFEKHIATLG